MPETTDPQPGRYRQRPNEVDAIQWTGSNADALRAFAGIDFDTIDPADRIDDPDCDAQLLVEASHWVGIKPTDWVLKFEGYFIAKDDGPFRAVWEPASTAPLAADLPARLEAVLTERFTELGNPFSAMRRHEKGPDGWPASHPVGPHHVAEVLREMLVAAPVPPSAPTDRAALCHDAAERITAYAADHFPDEYDEYADHLADEVRRMAVETQATPCSQPNPCEDGGDPCTTHEREQAHADGDHGICGAECTAGQPSLDGALRIVADWYASSEGRDVLIEDLAAAGYRLPDEEPTQ